MIAAWMRLGRLAFVLSLASATVAVPVAWADDDDEDEDEDEDEDGEDEEEDDDQPPVTAGGLYTKETYPLAETARPLTITKGLKEVRAGIDMDLSAQTAFETWGIALHARYGLEDNVELQFGVRSRLNNFSDPTIAGDDLRITAAFEGSIVYDVVNVRIGAVIPYLKSSSETAQINTTGFDLELGFPFRYSPKKEIAAVALDTFMTFNLRHTEYDPNTGIAAEGAAKPDLTPSIGAIIQPVEMLAIKVNAKLIIRNFNTEADNFVIPVSADVQFSPKNTFDMGLEFTFPNLKPPAPAKFTDSRFLLLYGQLRF
jgi:hypothetical protein